MNAITRVLTVATAVLAAGAAQTQAYAQAPRAYPAHPVRVVVGFTAGGPTDVIARIVAQKLADGLGQNFYVENVAGAGGNVAAAQVARAPADGYTLHVVSTGFMVNPSLYAKGAGYDPMKEFTPVALLAASPNVISVNPAVPAKTAQELIALIKANPGKYNFAQPGTGSTPHLNGELFKLAFGLDLVTVPFNGTAQLVTSTLNGDTPIAFTSLPSAMPIIRDGKLRAIVVLGKSRVDVLPDVPTAAEAGIPGHEGDTVTGIVAPAGTPKAVVDQVNAEIKKALVSADVTEKLKILGFTPVGSSPEEFGARITAEMTKWDKVIRDAKIRIE